VLLFASTLVLIFALLRIRIRMREEQNV
jgi:hypothetical protein